MLILLLTDVVVGRMRRVRVTIFAVVSRGPVRGCVWMVVGVRVVMRVGVGGRGDPGHTGRRGVGVFLERQVQRHDERLDQETQTDQDSQESPSQFLPCAEKHRREFAAGRPYGGLDRGAVSM